MKLYCEVHSNYAKNCVTSQWYVNHESRRRKGVMKMGFGQLLKAARKQSEKTLKEVSQIAGLSLGYISDIEQGRRKAPALDAVKRIEEYLGITDGALAKAAQSEKSTQTEVRTIFRKRPELSMQLLRASEFYDEEELTDMINTMMKNKGMTHER